METAVARHRDHASWWAGHVVARILEALAGTTVKGVVRATPETLTLARRRTQSWAAFVGRLTATAVGAYLLALLLAPSKGPVIAPLTALLIVQVTLYHTFRIAAHRIVAVVAGVLVAVGLSAVAGLTWWSLTILLFGGLGIGYGLRLHENALEVPISAMLILSLGSGPAATGRIIETIIGTGSGLIGGFLFPPLRVEPAEEAIDELSGQLASLLERIAGGLEKGREAVVEAADGWLHRARELDSEMNRLGRSLAEAEASLRLNPRARSLPNARITLQCGLETLEHSAVTIRGIARNLSEACRITDVTTIDELAVRDCLAADLRELAAAIAAIGPRVRAEIGGRDSGASRHDQIASRLEQHLWQACQLQDRLAELLRDAAKPGQPSWPLRGELLTHLNRLRNELQAEDGVPHQ